MRLELPRPVAARRPAAGRIRRVLRITAAPARAAWLASGFARESDDGLERRAGHTLKYSAVPRLPA